MRACAEGHPGCLYIGGAPHQPNPVPLTESRVREIVYAADRANVVSCCCTNQCVECGACCSSGCEHRVAAGQWTTTAHTTPLTAVPANPFGPSEDRVREIVREELAAAITRLRSISDA